MPYDPTTNPYIINPLELPANQTAAAQVPAKNIGTSTQWSQSPYYLPNWGRQNQAAGTVAAQATSPVATASIGWPDAIVEDRDLCAKASLNVEKTRVSTGDTTLQAQLTALNALLGGAPGLVSVTPNTGLAAGGTAVVLQGATFTGATGVTFGGTAATALVVADDGRITCTTPAHATGAVNVVITTPGGSSTLTGGFTYQ